jgi:MFS family permease
VLLRALVQVTLDPAAVGIRSENEPLPRRALLNDLGLQPVERVAPRLVLLSLQRIDLRVVDFPRLSAVARATSSRPALRNHDGSLPLHARRALLVPLATVRFNRRVGRARGVLSCLDTVARNGDIRRVQLAWGAAITAEWAHFVALGVFAYDAGGSVAVGLAGLVRMLPAALIAPFASSLGDHFRRERFLLAILLIGVGALGISAIAFFAGPSELLIFALAGVVGVASTLIRPAQQALLPSLARTPEELIASNGATSTIESLGTLVGPLLAGVLVSVADVGTVFALGGGAFLGAAILLARVRVEGRIDAAEGAAAENALNLVLAGYRLVARTARLRLIIGLIVAQTFVRGCLNVLVVVAVFRVFDAGPGAVGYLTAAIGIGGAIGALAAISLKGVRLAKPFGLALVFWGLPLMLLALAPNPIVAFFLLAVVGAANSVEDVAVFTLLQRIVPNDLLTRVLGVLWGLAMGAVALGSIFAPALVSAFGPRPAFLAAGAVLPVLVALTWRRLAEIDHTVTVPATELALIDQVHMFEPLSLAAKEQIAADLVSVSVAAGKVVIREGDPGDCFYLVAGGELEVDAEGLHREVGPGDYFGEIALMQDVPRTATVRATVDSTLFTLEREAFLRAVTGRPSMQAATAVVEARLAAGRAAPD